MFAFQRRADSDIDWSHIVRVADGLDELEKAIARCFQMSAALIILSISLQIDRIISAVIST